MSLLLCTCPRCTICHINCLFFLPQSELSRVDVDGKLFLHLVIGSIIVLSLYLALVSILTGPVGVHNSVGFTVGMLPLWAASLLFLIAWRIIRWVTLLQALTLYFSLRSCTLRVPLPTLLASSG